jgi:hypothetical protein
MIESRDHTLPCMSPATLLADTTMTEQSRVAGQNQTFYFYEELLLIFCIVEQIISISYFIIIMMRLIFSSLIIRNYH